MAAANASGPLRRAMMSAPLSAELKERYGVRSFPIRKGDTVKILRGDFSGIEGKVAEVNRKKSVLLIDGVTREKVSGTSVKVPLHTSKVIITNLDLGDKWRADALEGKKKIAKPAEAVEKEEAP